MVIRAFFFGRFALEVDDQRIGLPESSKLLVLLCYLLFNRQQITDRETISNKFWSGSTGAQSRKYLRNALWQLQKVLRDGGAPPSLLRISHETLSINPEIDVWLDVEVFTATYEAARDSEPAELSDDAMYDRLLEADRLYVSHFLEGWFYEWCLRERERQLRRLQVILDRLMIASIARDDFESAVVFGERTLSYDRWEEATYRKLMRLSYAQGDRTGALRYFERCRSVLEHDLDAVPSEETRMLADAIRADKLSA